MVVQLSHFGRGLRPPPGALTCLQYLTDASGGMAGARGFLATFANAGAMPAWLHLGSGHPPSPCTRALISLRMTISRAITLHANFEGASNDF